MNHKKIIIVGVVVLGILTLFMFNPPSNKTISQNILYLTQPATSFSGIVDKIEGNRLTISQKQTLTQNIVPPPAAVNLSNRPSPFPTPKTVTLTYQVIVTDKTQISQSPAFISYLFKIVTPALPLKSTVKDIKVGQYLTINSQVDLRTLVGNVFEATIVSLPPKTNYLNGKVVSLEGNTLTIKGFAPMMVPLANPGAVPATPQEKQYRISITSDTEISRNVYGANVNPGVLVAPKSEKLALSDLKVDMQITVYTTEDVTETQTLTALRVEPAASASPSVKP
ncbi:MAG: hypothetical protein AAB603_02520 [Patescibacteria group bacterium]